MINYPKSLSEFEIHAKVYNILLLNNVNVRGEVKQNDCRFDLVVFNNNNEAVAIIECKSWKRKRKSTQTKQLAKYLQYGLPVYVIGKESRIEQLIKKIVYLVNNPNHKRECKVYSA